MTTEHSLPTNDNTCTIQSRVCSWDTVVRLYSTVSVCVCILMLYYNNKKCASSTLAQTQVETKCHLLPSSCVMVGIVLLIVSIAPQDFSTFIWHEFDCQVIDVSLLVVTEACHDMSRMELYEKMLMDRVAWLPTPLCHGRVLYKNWVVINGILGYLFVL